MLAQGYFQNVEEWVKLNAPRLDWFSWVFSRHPISFLGFSRTSRMTRTSTKSSLTPSEDLF
jgi:hypothetical protein